MKTAWLRTLVVKGEEREGSWKQSHTICYRSKENFIGKIDNTPLNSSVTCSENHKQSGEIGTLNILFRDESPKICIDFILNTNQLH